MPSVSGEGEQAYRGQFGLPRTGFRPMSRSSNAPQQAAALFGVEPLKGVVKEFDRVRLLLGHDNRM